jgi:hypothetical protein
MMETPYEAAGSIGLQGILDFVALHFADGNFAQDDTESRFLVARYARVSE